MPMLRVASNWRPLLTITVMGLLVAVDSTVFAQRGGFSRDPREYIRGKDLNGNGILEPNELTGRARDALERSGQDISKPIPVETAIQIFEKASQEGGGGGRGFSGGPGPPGGGFPGSPGGFPGSPGGFPGSPGGFPGSPGGFPGRGWSGGAPPAGGGPTAPPGDNRGGATSRTESKPTVPGFSDVAKVSKPAGFSDPATAGMSGVGLDQRYDRRVIEYVERLFREFDKNHDDTVDELETKSAGSQIEFKESDLNKDGKLTKAELCERISQRWTAASGGAAVLASRTTSRGSATATSSASGGASEEAQKVRRYAESLLRQYDENKNGVLERNEWSQARSISRDADTNGDGTITLDELTAKLSNFGKEGAGGGASTSSPAAPAGPGWGGSPGGFSGGPPGRGDRGGSSSASRSAGSDRKVSYRQRSPLERLPKGLPDWFARNDANEDGQVTMAEFSTAWNEAKAAEFASFDLNSDGVVTAVECVKAGEKPKSADKSWSDRGGSAPPSNSFGGPRGESRSGGFSDAGARDRGGFRPGFSRNGSRGDFGSRGFPSRDRGEQPASDNSEKPADEKPADAKPAEEKPADAKPADAKPDEPKADAPKAPEGTPAEPNPADPKPAGE